jgi:hypothetical protein
VADDIGQGELNQRGDGLRGLADLASPDARFQHINVSDAHGSRGISQADRHANISQYVLSPEVPEDVRVHFDTARNLYLYAWHAYRFHAVAEQQVLGSLELALRTRFVQSGELNPDGLLELPLPVTKKKQSRDPELTPQHVMLKRLLSHAVLQGLITNDRIKNRALWTWRRAESLAELRVLQAGIAGDDELVEIEIDPADLAHEHDWIGAFEDALPHMRNTYAHGSAQIHASVLRTFDICSDLINQLFTAGA